MALKVPCDYVPSRFAAAVITTPKPRRVNVNVYSCTITSTGSRNESDSISAIYDAAQIIARYGMKIEFLESPGISNITAVVYPGDEKIDPQSVAQSKKVPFFSSHVKVKDPHNHATILVAKSGRVTITGVKSTGEILNTAKRLFGCDKTGT